MPEGDIKLTTRQVIPARELSEQWIRASGPGGQNVNKVETAVQLRFNVQQSSAFDEVTRRRVLSRLGSRLTRDGELLVECQTHRRRERNRSEARRRLAELLSEAAQPPKRRKKTRPSAAARARRVDAKKRRGALKKQRRFEPGKE